MPKVESIIIKKFKSNTGYIFDNISLSYQLYGQKIGDSPIILVNHSLTGNSSLTGDSGWWSEIVGIDKAIDLKYFTVIAFDIPGNGYYYPTIENYTELNCNDIAKIFYLGLEKIGVFNLFAIVGGSIGGGITWEMASLNNKFAEVIIPVACDWQASDWILANTYLQKRILKNSKNPLQDARIHAMLSYRTPISLNNRFSNKKNKKGIHLVEEWLSFHGESLLKRFNLEAYKAMNHLLSTVDITGDEREPQEVLSTIKSNIHIVSIDSDYYFTLERDIYTYNLIKSVKKNVYHHIIESVHGHDGFLIENKKMSKILSKILIESKNGNNTRKNKQRLSI
ncbi:MAG: alpha/beta fold hydrolase [Flavobacteriaceae bacterium]